MENFNCLVELPELEELNVSNNGIITIDGLEIKFPNLTMLDLSHNKIFSVNNLDILQELPNLAEIRLDNNPINVHK